MNNLFSNYYKSKQTTDGKTTTFYHEVWIPFFGKIFNCHNRESMEFEKELYNLKNNKK